MKKSIYLVFFFCLLLSACNNNLKKEYFNDGSLKKEYYCDENELKYGIVTEYYNDGRVKWQSYYFNDTLNGAYKEYHPNGRLSKITNLKNGLQDGRIITYSMNGKLLQNTQYKLGQREGLGLFFYQNGHKRITALAKNGLTQYKIEYDSITDNIIKEKHLIEISFLNELIKTDSIKIKANVMGFYNPETSVFALIEKYGFIKEGDVPKMIFNIKDSCYYYTLPPQKEAGKYKIQISLLVNHKFEQKMDTVIMIRHF